MSVTPTSTTGAATARSSRPRGAGPGATSTRAPAATTRAPAATARPTAGPARPADSGRRGRVSTRASKKVPEDYVKFYNHGECPYYASPADN